MNIYPSLDKSKSNKIEVLNESAVYSSDDLFYADYLDNGTFNVCIKRKDLYIGVFKFVSGRWVYIDDFGDKFMKKNEWGSLENFLTEFDKTKSV